MPKPIKPTLNPITKKSDKVKKTYKDNAKIPIPYEDPDQDIRFKSSFFSRDIFSKILKEAEWAGIIPNKNKESRTWLQNKARESMVTSMSFQLQAKEERRQTNVQIGSMYLAAYDAKTKDDLPYWDAFPVIIPFDYTNNGFLSLNLHYLPPALRAKLFDALWSIRNDRRYNAATQFNITYETLKGAAKFKAFAPCVKRYLWSHFKSYFYYVKPEEWAIGVFLPVANFKKASNQKVWADSIRKINKR